ncbi:hypothetical protein [Stenotrophomonas maltophilia]|uniref:hypothetical protein n=1 Tax=Stenotrophomonas maltophilia TaxID=40324 RepID=UPI0015DEA9EB|nr:hypothetical protein [Stenotrophomonas maltophilia]MBA0332783.1 hypothetical protein [Stenotrophomonas maltophilia]MEA1827347.1 hypothetical protein [Stenotrophomonas maltophilia]
MDAIEKRARELLAAEYERFDLPGTAAVVRDGEYDLNPSMRALVAALTPPDGYVLVPVVPTKQMMDAAVPASSQDQTGRRQRATWDAMLSARPEVPS